MVGFLAVAKRTEARETERRKKRAAGKGIFSMTPAKGLAIAGAVAGLAGVALVLLRWLH